MHHIMDDMHICMYTRVHVHVQCACTCTCKYTARCPVQEHIHVYMCILRMYKHMRNFTRYRQAPTAADVLYVPVGGACVMDQPCPS